MIPERLKSNINLDASPTDPKHIVNKEYVDGNHVEISWADYQSLPDEEKNNGTIYFVPDMPVSTSGEIIGNIEYGDFFSSDIKGSSLSIGCIIDFNQKTSGNLTYYNGVKLNKGKFYLVYCNIAYLRNDEGNSHLRFEVRINGNQIWATNGIAIASGSTSAWSDGALLIHYNCVNDNDVLTINCVSVDGVDTILGGLSKLVITEIPSLQACINVSDEHIKEISQSSLSEKDYLKLSTLSNGGYARISSWVDSNNGRTQMSFDINTSDGKTERIQFDNIDGKLSVYENDGNDNWTYKGRYIKTNVDDIPQTALTYNDTTNYKPESTHVDYGYRVLNGICYLQVYTRVVASSISPITICNLPKPAQGVRGTSSSWTNTDPSVLDIKYGVYTEDSTLRLWDGTVGQAYMIRISYPVAES